jgi:LTXXQ motif family protein
MRASKLTIGFLGATALVALLACDPALAQNKHGGGPPAGGGAAHGGGGGGGGGAVPHLNGGGGGGGAPHFGGGGAPHAAAPQINAAPHVSAPQISAAPHVNMAPHVSAPAHISVAPHGGAPHFGGARGGAPHISLGRGGPGIAHISPRLHAGTVGRPLRGPSSGGHVRTATPAGPLTTRGARGIARHGATPNAIAGGTSPTNRAAINAARTAGLRASVNRLSGVASAQNFAAHRGLAGAAALRPFLNDPWHRRHHHHLGWIGPLFWPYAYGDVFYYALWPYEYADYDPFWAYGYGDVYEAIFPSADYGLYVRGRRGATRMTALRRSVAQSCTDEAAEVTGWPIDQIQAAVQPDQQQRALLDDLGNAVVQASEVIKSHCPQEVAFTAPARLADMQKRLEGLVQAIDIVQPPLAKFYDALNDEQKARFNALGEPQGRQPPQGRQTTQNLQNQCGENAVAWPADKIGQAVRPDGAQRTKLDALDAAARDAADAIKAVCPSELPATPPDRLAAEGKRLQAILQAVQTIRPKLDEFYASLSSEQKARFNTIGRQLFAER